MPKVGVVGAGVIAPHAIGCEQLWTAATAGVSYAESVADTGSQQGVATIACRVSPTWMPDLSSSELRRWDRVVHFAVGAADQAVGDVSALFESIAPERRGLVVGIGFGGIATLAAQHEAFQGGGWRKLSPFGVAAVMPSSAASVLALRHSIRGPVATVSSACASGTHAIVDAFRMLVAGDADIVLAGGAEAPIHPYPIAGFLRMDAMSRRVENPAEASRPFDARRDGFVLSEGAGFLVLARAELSREVREAARGYVSGAALTTDAHHITAPDPEGASAARCIQTALERAGLPPSAVGHVNAHGTATVLNDVAEATALRRVFGSPPPVTSLKGAFGHAMGAAGAIEAVATIESVSRAVVPPTANCSEIASEIDLDVVMRSPRSISSSPAVTCSFGFGGQNAALVIEP